MRKSFKVAPGVRVTASSRGISTRVGPFSTSTARPRSSRRSSSSGRSASSGPTKASITAYERELKAAQRDADIERVAALENALVSVHAESFPRAERVELAPIAPVDPGAIEGELEAEAGIPAMIEPLGGGDGPPVAAAPEPVDRYELMREHRRRERQGIPLWRLRERIEAARRADATAEAEAKVEDMRRQDERVAEQARLDGLWADLQAARESVARQLPERVGAETERREAKRAAEQAELDREWEKLSANDPELTIPALERAFADNEAPAAPIDCDADRVTVLMRFPTPEEIVPERKPAHTPTGKPTLKKRTKTEVNDLYLRALGSNVLATVKEAFAVAPGAQTVQMLVVRREADGKRPGELAAIYVGDFDRNSYDAASGSRDPRHALEQAVDAELNLKGKTEQVAPLELSERPDLESVLVQVSGGLNE
jgi:hypothetical protein